MIPCTGYKTANGQFFETLAEAEKAEREEDLVAELFRSEILGLSALVIPSLADWVLTRFDRKPEVKDGTNKAD